MSDQDRELRDLMTGLTPGEAPPFRRMWKRAGRDRRRRVRRRRLVLAAAAGVLAVTLAIRWSDPRPAPAPEVAGRNAPDSFLELASSLDDWQTPLDFLLEPPSGGLATRPALPGDEAWRLLDSIHLDLDQLGETL